MVMNTHHKILYSFKCDKCKKIISINLETKEDIEEAEEDNLVVECNCGAYAKRIWN
mgnify:CR=1 FL=1